MTTRVGVVVPTLGTRPEFLTQALQSIRDAGQAFVVIVAPMPKSLQHFLAEQLCDSIAQDPGAGLPNAINIGVESLPPEIEFVTWLGDDDLLAPGSLNLTAKALDSEPTASAVFGACDYVNEHGNVVWRNQSGQFAARILKFGPDLIPQPGSLIRRRSWQKVGGLSTKYALAFDFDLFIKLKSVGKLIYLNQTLASFRWHTESLSVATRKQSVMEASAVRRSHLPAWVRGISVMWELPIRLATFWAGQLPARGTMSKAN